MLDNAWVMIANAVALGNACVMIALACHSNNSLIVSDGSS